MNQYTIHVTDKTTGDPLIADLYMLESAGGNPILVLGQPSAFQTDVNGNYSFSSDATQIFVKLQSTGYQSQNLTLNPGNNNLQLDALTGPMATITGSRTFYNKYKTFIFLILIMAAVFAAIKYKLV